MMHRAFIYDTTLRDGEQAPGFSMTAKEKLLIAEELATLKVDTIEVGFPACSETEQQAAALIARRIKGPQIAVMARCREDDIDKCLDAVHGAESPRIHVFISTSDLHIEHKLKSTRDRVLESAVDAVRYARNKCEDIQFGCEDATRADRDYLRRLIDGVISAGARTITIADTVGAMTPLDYADLIQWIRAAVADSDLARIGVHCHDDLGLATANSLAGLAAGALQVECTINGIGERAGNAALEEIVTVLHVRSDAYGLFTTVQASGLVKASRLLQRITGVSVPPNKAIVGGNAFRHGAGIHQHGVLVNERLYQFLSAEDVGAEPMSLAFGKYSGRHAIESILRRSAIDVDPTQIDILVGHVKSAAGKRALSESEVVPLIRQFVAGTKRAVVGPGLTTCNEGDDHR